MSATAIACEPAGMPGCVNENAVAVVASPDGSALHDGAVIVAVTAANVTSTVVLVADALTPDGAGIAITGASE